MERDTRGPVTDLAGAAGGLASALIRYLPPALGLFDPVMPATRVPPALASLTTQVASRARSADIVTPPVVGP